jgi:seryl-tRNA synthetase
VLGLKKIRENPTAVQAQLDRRNGSYSLQPIVELDGQQRAIEGTRSELQARSNEVGKAVGEKMQSGVAKDSPEILALKEEGNRVKAELAELEPREREIKQQLETLLLQLPNLPSETTPIGADEDANVEVRRWGDELIPKDAKLPHWEIGEKLGILNFERSTKIAQSRFVTLLATRKLVHQF